MKFEPIQPPEDTGDDAVSVSPIGPPSTEDMEEQALPVLEEAPDGGLVPPVRRRMSRALDGVRTSLDRLRAHAAEQAMAQARAQARRAATTAAEVDPGAVFHAHRFSASPKRGER